MISYKKIFLPLCIAFLAFPAFADTSNKDVLIADPYLTRNGELMSSGLTLDFSGLHMGRNEASVFTPMIVNGSDTLCLPSIGVYGRTRWYQYERKGNLPTSHTGDISLRYSSDMAPVQYVQNVGYSGWMNGSELILRRTDYGCAGCDRGEETIAPLAEYRLVEYRPVFQFAEALAETVKTREISGRAFVDFKVNQIVILPEYRNNTYELGKIIATIDSVKNDKDITVTSLHIAGTASPEGPYDNNVYLAKNRTIALKDYVQKLYSFPDGFITTSYEPVDWKGLCEWLENHNLENKEAILAIVNSDIEPYARNSKIRKDFPVQYDWLLKNVYPSLRHSDYRIEYNIRQFSDVTEIAEVLRTAPQKLSLNEIYLLAGAYEPGSPEYNEVFETAVRLFPEDETANLNAANAAMMGGNYNAAERYLVKAGNSSKAIYARGVLEALRGNYDIALPLVEKAISLGMEDNSGILDNLREAARYAK